MTSQRLKIIITVLRKDKFMYLGYQNGKIKFYTENKLEQEFYNLDKVEETDKEYILQGEEYVLKPDDYEEQLLKQAQQAKLQEASNKAFEYRNVTGLVSFNARPVDTSLLEEGETTLVLHTELLNQNDFFQRMTGFSTGMFTDDIIYNTKEDILVYLNAEETQAIYYAIINKAGKLWNEDYMTYKALIEACTTAEEVEQIVIDYDNVPVIEDEVTDEDTTDDNESDVQDELDTTTSESDETDTDNVE
ncbi:MAG: hypothetical protein ACI3T9_05870 [Romboutsia timonensis]